MNIIVIGPAASGKSVFVKSFKEFLIGKGYNAKAINLDPATNPIYKADRDIRKFVKTEEVMEKYKLGINGALMRSVEIAGEHIEDLVVEGDFVLIDTPGQMELFIYSKAGRKIVECLPEFKCCIFLVDSEIALNPENFISILMQNVIVSLRTSLPTLTIFNKSDLVKLKNYDEIMVELKNKPGVLAELLEKTLFFFEYTSLPYRQINISALNKTGFEDVFDAINELFCSCGDIS
ncbi:GTPase [Archaeoglobales archaeon]|nr:MAG: GTPase [Archaeoglobales archaeon]